MRFLKRLGYFFSRKLIAAIARPRISGLVDTPLPADVIYVLERRALSDIIILDLVCEAQQQPHPLQSIEIGELQEARRFFFLNRPTGWLRRNTMRGYSKRLLRILEAARVSAGPHPVFVPVAVFWGRSPNRERSTWRLFFSENWAATSRFRRLVNLAVNRRDIVVNFGSPLPIDEILENDAESNRLVRRAARLLRVRLRNQRVAAMGPDFSHRRTLINQILQSRSVREAIAADPGRSRTRVLRRARRNALSIASNLSYPWIRFLERLLTWFWNKIYNGIEFHGIEQIQQLSENHTLVYVPTHRSHVDYLLLSYLLFQRGLMIPHIAAGDNLNLPVLGGILRKGGAFFMRRSFRDDPLYSAVFTEYLYQVYRRGHCVEFFPEGGRTRTGRLLPPKLGLVKMTLEHHARGIPRPIAFVPVYCGYEKLIEASAYMDELRGAKKRRESWGDLLRSLRLIRQNFGKVYVNIGEPMVLENWLQANAHRHPADRPLALGRDIMHSINAAAHLNPVNLVSLVTLATPRIAIEREPLARQIDLYRQLLANTNGACNFRLTELTGTECVDYVVRLGLMTEHAEQFGRVYGHDAFSTLLMTWYRNNVAHCLALPSLIACLVIHRRRPLAVHALHGMVQTLYPYLSRELTSSAAHPEDAQYWCERLCEFGLLEAKSGEAFAAPAAGSEKHYQLNLLTRVVSQTLERMFIVIGLLEADHHGALTRQSLQSRSQNVAQKMTRLYGLNAPEFFDARLFNQFIDQLMENGVLEERADGVLRHSPIIEQVLKASEPVIDPEFRYAVLRACADNSEWQR